MEMKHTQQSLNKLSTRPSWIQQFNYGLGTIPSKATLSSLTNKSCSPVT